MNNVVAIPICTQEEILAKFWLYMSERRVENLFKIPALGWLAAGRNLIA
jgi:hypothetical protein